MSDDYFDLYQAAKRRVFALEAHNQVLREALDSLTHEICGWLGLYGEFLRPYSGNTNIAVMKDRVEGARAALAAPEENL